MMLVKFFLFLSDQPPSPQKRVKRPSSVVISVVVDSLFENAVLFRWRLTSSRITTKRWVR